MPIGHSRTWICYGLLGLFVAALWMGTALGAQARRYGGRPSAGAGSLYQRLGGIQAIALVVDDLVDRLLKDPVITVNPNVIEATKHVTVPGLKVLITEFVGEATGGPQQYSGRSMKESHRNLRITEQEWDAFVADTRQTLVKFKVPEREQNERLAALGTTKKDIVMAPNQESR